MKQLVLALLFFSTIAGAQQVLAITHVSVIDATGGPVRPDTTVIIAGDRITAIGPTSAVKVPAGARIVDGSRKFLIPGLWDMHVHSAFTDWFAGSREMFLPLLVANGVTGIRDIGGDLQELQDRRREIESGRVLGPQIIASGPMLDGPTPTFSSSIGVATVDEAVRAVQALKRRGADFIKIQSTVSRDVYFAIVKEAHRLNLQVAGHVPDAVPAEDVADSGQNSIEHIGFLLVASADPAHRKEVTEKSGTNPGIMADYYSSDQAAKLAKRLRKNGTWICPTLAWSEITPLDEFDAKTDPRSRYVPPFVIDKVWPKLLEINQMNIGRDKIKANRLKLEPKVSDLIGKLRQEGVPLLAGTDTPCVSVYPGFSLHEELAYLVRAGLTPMEALQTATRNAAQYLGILANTGTVQTGKRADLILLEANPLDDIRNTQNISAVVVKGRLVDRSERAKLLQQVETQWKVR